MNPRDQHDTGAGIPDWKCERFLLHELDEAEMETIRRAAAHDENLRARLEAITHSNREILRDYPPGWMAQQIRRRLGEDSAAVSAASRTRTSWLSRRVVVPAGLMAALAVAVIVVPRLISTGDPSGLEVTRIKGAPPRLRVYRETPSGSELLEDGTLAAEHDVVLLQYGTDEPGYGAILSVDGRGTITRHLPVSGSGAVVMEGGEPRFMEHAYELDAAPRWEVFLFVTSSRPFQVESVIRSIQEALSFSPSDSVSSVHEKPLSHLELPGGLRASRFTLIKGARHEN